MSSLIDSGAIFSYHRAMIDIHGSSDSKALGWRDKQSQLVRFEAFTRIGNFYGCSLLDAGCGYGDLYGYLSGVCPKITYWGVEQIPELLDEAARRYGNCAGVTFLSTNFMHGKLPVCDYVLASGSLNYGSEDPDFIFKAISRLYDCCRLALGFNLLRHIPGNGLIVAYDPEIIIAYCRSLDARVVLVNDYDPEDFTIFLYR